MNSNGARALRWTLLAAAIAWTTMPGEVRAQTPVPAAAPGSTARTTTASTTTAGTGTTSTAAGPGYAESNVDGNQVVTFPNDTLAGDENSAYGFVLRQPPRVLRAGLLRPRMNFVPELLKSVENL